MICRLLKVANRNYMCSNLLTECRTDWMGGIFVGGRVRRTLPWLYDQRSAHVAMATITRDEIDSSGSRPAGRVESGWQRSAALKAVIESASFNAVSRTLGAYFSVIDSRRRLKAPLPADRSRFLLSKSRRTRSGGLVHCSFHPLVRLFLPPHRRRAQHRCSVCRRVVRKPVLTARYNDGAVAGSTSGFVATSFSTYYAAI